MCDCDATDYAGTMLWLMSERCFAAITPALKTDPADDWKANISSQPIMLKNVKLGILYYPKTNLYSTDMKIYFKYLYVTKSLSSPGRYIFAWYLEIPVFRSIVFDG